jgi:hypothetical protein
MMLSTTEIDLLLQRVPLSLPSKCARSTDILAKSLEQRLVCFNSCSNTRGPWRITSQHLLTVPNKH